MRLASGGYVFSQLISFGAYVALARLLSPTAFGHFAAASIVVGVAMVVGESGLLGAVVQRRDTLEEAFNSAFLATLGRGSLSASSRWLPRPS